VSVTEANESLYGIQNAPVLDLGDRSVTSGLASRLTLEQKPFTINI